MMIALCLLIVAVTGFLLGSFPTGFLVAKTKGIDIRQHGSGNIGATNVLRVLGKKLGYFVFAVDALKGALAVVVAGIIAIRFGSQETYSVVGQWAPITGGIAGILGHNYTPWLGFKGGKGVATSAGVLLSLLPIVIASVVAVWLIVFYSSRFVSLASIVAGIALPVCTWLLVIRLHPDQTPLLWFSILVGGMLVLRHKTNIQRLLAGTEPRFQKKK